ncbi:hypothetical protein LSH36_660g06016 [Paralvinella palmiformis]|uniref:Uncharacterized protein n=1 Tax=Paralvinella palmiformis TaxID=53620 RepID=A0AAD9J303_9ANNE|nr:hypothetical protein LSH36_660g06016 [Paralvinella palmiformis]
MAKPSLPSSFSDTAEHNPQIKQRINAKFKYVHSQEKRVTDTLRINTDSTKFPMINATKNRSVTFSRSGRVVKDQGEKKAQSGLSVFTILKYDHTKQESSLACLGLDSSAPSGAPQQHDPSLPYTSLKSRRDGASGGQATSVPTNDEPNSSNNKQDTDSREPTEREGNNDQTGCVRVSTPVPESDPHREPSASESRVISSAVRRFRTFIMKETAQRGRQDCGDDARSDASHDVSMTPSTRSELGSQLSSRKTYPGRGRASGNVIRDLDLDERLGYTPSERMTTAMGSKTNPVSRERESSGYYTPYRYSVRSEKGDDGEARVRGLKSSSRNHGTRRSSCKIDIGKLNKRKSDLVQNSVRDRPSAELELPSVIDSQGNLVDQTSELLGLENELGRSRTQHSDWFGHRTRGTSRYRGPQIDGGDSGGGADHYQWKADITQPISFISPARNVPSMGKDYGNMRTKYRLLKAEPSKVDEVRSLQHKAAILRRLKGIFKKKPAYRNTNVCDYGGPSDMANIQLAPAELGAETSRMKGGRAFKRREEWPPTSNWTSSSRGLPAGRRTRTRMGTALNEGPSSLRSVDLSTPIDRELVISQAGRCPSRGVYELRMGDKSVLIIDHPRNRAARQARIRPQIEAAFLGRQEVALSSEDLATNSSMWVPPNTPHYDVTGRSMALDEGSLTLNEDVEKVNQLTDGSVYSEL